MSSPYETLRFFQIFVFFQSTPYFQPNLFFFFSLTTTLTGVSRVIGTSTLPQSRQVFSCIFVE